LYPPLDTYHNARYFVQLFQPDLAIFVKYEFWYHFLYFLKKSGVPLFLVSGIFRENHIFFRPWGGLFRRTLRAFETLFVQNEFSRKMLAEIGIKNVVVTGDTRFDRVIQITERAKDIPEAMQFSQQRDTVVCGSTWPEDEAFITAYINAFPEHFKWIIAPHEINEDHLKQLEARLTVQTVRFSKFRAQDASARVLLIDNYGMLSTLYRYACMAYVGGGFGKGLHNILEAATYGIPVLFGPRHQRFREAIALNYRGGGFALQAPQEFASYVRRLRNHPEVRKMAGDEAFKYIHNSRGATEKVMMDLRPRLQQHCS
jgi:3-deoxy-D-manno-octulosonic-acid transferase